MSVGGGPLFSLYWRYSKAGLLGRGPWWLVVGPPCAPLQNGTAETIAAAAAGGPRCHASHSRWSGRPLQVTSGVSAAGSAAAAAAAVAGCSGAPAAAVSCVTGAPLYASRILPAFWEPFGAPFSLQQTTAR